MRLSVTHNNGRWHGTYQNGRDLTISCQSFYLSEVLAHLDREFQGKLFWKILEEEQKQAVLVGDTINPYV